MKFHQNHPSVTAYYRDLQVKLFVAEVRNEYGDNLFIEHAHGPHVPERTTLGAIKIMAFDELMQADPVEKLRKALDAMLRDPMNAQARDQGLRTLLETRRFGADWSGR